MFILSLIIVGVNLLIFVDEFSLRYNIFLWGTFGLSILLSNKKVSRYIPYFLMIIPFVLIYLEIKQITLRNVDAAVFFLTTMLVFKLFELKKYRDFFNLFLITTLVSSGALILKPTFFTLVWAFISIFLTFYFVIKLNEYEIKMLQLKKILIFFLPTIPLCFLLFFFFPRFTAGFQLGNFDKIISGQNDELRVENLNDLTLVDTPMFTAYLESEKSLSPTELYWKTNVLWDFDGAVFRLGSLAMKNQSITFDQTTKYKIKLENLQNEYLPLLDRGVGVEVNAPVQNYKDGSFKFSNFLQKKQVFDASSSLIYKDLAFNEQIKRKSLRIKNYKSKEIESFLEKLYEKKTLGIEEKLLKLSNHFKTSGFTYSLSPGPFSTFEDFLFRKKRGYCSHFAASFVLLSRLSGIPARLVNGFQGGIFNEIGGFYQITAKDSHAWVEVYLADKGWIRVDPTEWIYPERITLGAHNLKVAEGNFYVIAGLTLNKKNLFSRYFDRFSQVVSYLNATLSLWFYEYDKLNQDSITKKLGLSKTNYLFSIVIFIIVTSLLIFYFYLERKAKIKKSEATLNYLKFLKQMKKRGFEKLSYEGPISFSKRLLEAFPEEYLEINEAINSYINLEYGEKYRVT